MKKQILLIVSVFVCWSVSAQERISYEEFIRIVPNLTKHDTEDFKKSPQLLDAMWMWVKQASSRTLGRLGYGTGPFVSQFGAPETSAIKAFQRDVGIQVTGQLDSATLSFLENAETYLFYSEMSLPPKLVWVDQELGLARASGTWKAENYLDAWPCNTQVMDFSRSDWTLEVSNTHISEMGEKWPLGQSRSLYSFHHTYEITRWDEELIVAESNALCAKTIITLNIESSDVTFASYVTRRDSLCGFLEKGPKFSTLVGGEVVFSKKNWKTFSEIVFRNSDAGKIFDKLKLIQE